MTGATRCRSFVLLLAAFLVLAFSPQSDPPSPASEIAQPALRPGEPSAEDVELWLGVSEGYFVNEAGEPVVEPLPTHPTPMPKGDLSGGVVAFTRCCAGNVEPDYRIELRGDGQAMFDGRDALVTGLHRFRVSPDTVQRLITRLEAANFWGLHSKYDCGMSHGARFTLSVELGGRKKTVFHHCGVGPGLPQNIVEIERAIVTAAEGARWIVGNDATLVQLEQEQFDFNSVAGADMLSRAMMYSSDAFIVKLLARGMPFETSHGPLIGDVAFHGRREAFETLVRVGAFHENSGAKNAALERAIQACRSDMIAAVLPYKPDLTARSKDYGGRNLLELAELCSDSESGTIRQALIAAGADPKTPGRFTQPEK